MHKQCPNGDRPLVQRTVATMHAGTTTTVRRQAAQVWRSVRRVVYLACVSFVLLPLLTACAMEPKGVFDSTAWKSQRGVDSEKNERIYMLVDMEKRLRVGMPREEVIEMLGPADYSEHGGVISTDVYYLGIAPYGVDTQQYSIQYQDDKVVAHHLVDG